jgi:tRNA/tmRNA/rRNA uracil-C5-methylase (TrmA/RlmC/RlmD family)
MIHSALTYVKDILNENFKKKFKISENKVVLSNIVNPDGSIVHNTDNKIVFFLLNLDQEATLKNNINRSSNSDSSFTQRKPSLHLNIHLIFCANFIEKNYEEGLRYLSALISFFQNNNKLTPKLSNNINNNQLLFEMCRLNYSELSNVWSTIGSKMTPFVIYKVRILAMDDSSISKMIPAIKTSKNQS